jgi:hypothetical protein
VSAPILVAVQSVVGWDRRGVVTSTNLFSRSIGSAVGVAVFGAIANVTLDGQVTSISEGATGSALFDAAHHVFISVAVFGFLLLVAVALVPARPRPLFPDPQP